MILKYLLIFTVHSITMLQFLVIIVDHAIVSWKLPCLNLIMKILGLTSRIFFPEGREDSTFAGPF